MDQKVSAETSSYGIAMSTPLEVFFAQFANLGFKYRSRNTAHHNFKRLSRAARWEENSRELTIARLDFSDALVQQFNHVFGTGTDLESWQRLCMSIDIIPVPDTVKKCRKLVWDAHVNIVDLLECERTGKPVCKFATLEDLRGYTINSGKIFPKHNAYAGGLLRELLREIFNEYHGLKRQNGSEKRKQRKERKRAAAAESS